MTHTKLKEVIESFRNPYTMERYCLPSACSFQSNVHGLDQFLRSGGVRFFTGKELATPYHPDIAKKLGWVDGLLIPSNDRWAWGLACAIIAEQVRFKIGDPLLIANWYRPEPYNANVGGAAGGDHPSASAVDIQFLSKGDRALERARGIAVPYLKELYASTDYMSLGLYKDKRRIHIGVCTPKGKRTWG